MPATAATEPAVALTAVSKRYQRRGPFALDEVSLSFPRGTFTAVMGLSGSGKSTLLHCAAGLDRPTSGSVRLAGHELTTMKRKELSVLRRRKVGFVFQSLNLVPTLTVAENIALPLRLDGRPVDRADVAALADRVGVGPLLRRLPGTLSGGQQQRVGIARALITRPDVVFADEPTAALDPYTALGVRDLLRWAADELGQTIILVTHEPVMAEAADRVIVLDRGEVFCDTPTPDAAALNDLLLRLGSR
jgi:putative ABC transport system ATP-binding protein